MFVNYQREMEKTKCKLCFRSFANGRALGGHMRSHVAKPESESVEGETGSASLSDEERDALCYGLRENPRRSIKLADPEFSFVGPVQVQDHESEADSSKNPVRRRSNRFMKLDEPGAKRAKMDAIPVSRSECFGPEPEPVSSISDATTEEDVAYCLMMMKRDKWISEEVVEDAEDDDDDVGIEDGYRSDESMKQKKIKHKYKCETCDKVFKSYQALGGHRASHKKIKIANNTPISIERMEKEEKIHECPVCFRVFSSGQALGGHKRSHVVGSSSSSVVVPPKQGIRIGEKALIDLNLPAPVEDDDDDDMYSQIEFSALSEADLVNNSIRH